MFAVPPNTVVLPAPRAEAHPVHLALAVAADVSRWRPMVRYDAEHRRVHLLERTGGHEVWLLSWLPGQRTGLHDHGGATGAFTVVGGWLSERVVRSGSDGTATVVAHRVAAGQARVFGPDHVHQVSNTGVDPAVSIHVYRPARAAMTPYHLGAGATLTRAT